MSSLLQHDGETLGNRVVLKACRTYDAAAFGGPSYKHEEPSEYYVQTCPQCGKHHEAVYRFPRRPVGMWGCWVVFRYNGEEHVPDLSIPLSLSKLPRDAKRMTAEEAAHYWHSV